MKKTMKKLLVLGAILCTTSMFTGCKSGTTDRNSDSIHTASCSNRWTTPAFFTPTERKVAAMPDSLFDGRPHIIVNDGFHDLNAKQIAMLRTFSNPYAPKIAAIIEHLDSVMRVTHDTITTREALMQYYHYFDKLEEMTNLLSAEEQSQILSLE